MRKNVSKIYSWCSDMYVNTGEGVLALAFLYHLSKSLNSKIICETIEGKKSFYFKKKNNYKAKKHYLTFLEKYYTPFKGIYLIWKYHLKGYDTCYINFLPLWNFFVFLLLPKKTILGPITGTTLIKKNITISYIIRKFLFPIFYKISIFIMFKKWNKFIFSTDLLKNKIPKIHLRNVFFNFQLTRIKFKKIKKKKIDFLVYYRKHANKYDTQTISMIKKLSYSFKIYVVGDFLNISNIKNLGYIDNNKLRDLLSISKMTVSSSENLYSNFNIDCINNNMKILYLNKKKNNKILKSSIFHQIFHSDLQTNVLKFNLKIKKIINKKIYLANELKYLNNVKTEFKNFFVEVLKSH